MPATSFFLRTIPKVLFLCWLLFSPVAPAQDQDDSRGAPLERDDATEIREQMKIAASLLGKTPDQGAVLYFLAASNALLGETLPAVDQLKKCLALKEGFDPSGDNSFAALKTSPDFQKLLEDVHKDFPAVNLSKVAIVSAEKDIFPEGLAYDPHDDCFYLSSIYHRKIIKIPYDGKAGDFVPSNRYNLLPVEGIRIDPADGTIWSASSSDTLGTSELLHFDRSGTLLGRYASAEKGKHDFNDLVVLRSGNVYLTDTLANKTLHFDPKTHSFSGLTAPRALLLPNGIALTEDEQILYVADQLGVLRIDLLSGAGAEVDPGAHNTLAGIDGLYWHKGNLIAVQNGIGTPRVVVFRLSPDGLRVVKTTVLQNFLKTPTTGAIRGDNFYFILNTEIDNLNGEHILDKTKLQPVRIAVVRLP
jgi:DNA-binding beta-propeller fold protein YncE